MGLADWLLTRICLHFAFSIRRNQYPSNLGRDTSQTESGHSFTSASPQRFPTVSPPFFVFCATIVVVAMADTENVPPRRSSRLRSGTTTSAHSSSLDRPTKSTAGTSVTPLRIAKNTSKSKLAGVSEDTSTILRDISPVSSRRNSPSAFQIKDKLAAFEKTNKSSPTSSPQMGSPGVVKAESTSSVRNFWQNAAGEQTQPGSPSDLKRKGTKSEADDLKNLRSSYVKNNVFLTNDMRERESSPKLTMSPSQHRLSAQLGETTASTTLPATPTSPTKIPAPVDTTRKEFPKASPGDVTPKHSCLHSNRIKGPRDNDPGSPTPGAPHGSRERRKTVTFDEAPQVQEFDRRSSDGTTSSAASTYSESSQKSEQSDDFDDKIRELPARPLPQVPVAHSDSDRPSSQASNDSDYSDMEERIRSMMERVVLRDATATKQVPVDQEDIFSLYTTTNEMEDSQQSDETGSARGFSSQESAETAGTSQGNSQDEDLARHMALAKQGDELLEVIKSRPFSLQGLPELGFVDDAEEEGGLGLEQFCSPEPEVRPATEPPPPPVAKARPLPPNPTDEATQLDITTQPPVSKSDQGEPSNDPITPPLESPEPVPPPPQTPQHVLPPAEQLPSTPPSSPQKHQEEEGPSPVVPEREATIRSRGGSKLRVRPSLSRQEAQSLIERRRKSGLPPLPNLREQSLEPGVKVKIEEDDDLHEFGGKKVGSSSSKSVGLPMLKIEDLGFEKDSLSVGFGELAVEEMERVIEAQKVLINFRSYLCLFLVTWGKRKRG